VNTKPTKREREHLELELWAPVYGWESLYEVSNMGHVRSIFRARSGKGGGAIRSINNASGYPVVNLTAPGGRRKQLALHRVVLEAFCGPRPLNTEGCHYDGVRTNARLSNLRWDTRSANHQDKRRHGTAQIGERANNVKLSTDTVRAIRMLKLSPSQAVRIFGLSKTNAARIVRNETWRHVCAE
jgi:hypothetical protein